MKMIIAGNECENCKWYSSLTSKNNVKVLCLCRHKEYYYGQRIPCEDKEKDDKAKSD